MIDACIDVYSPYATFRKHLSGRNLKRLVSVLSAANTVNVLSFKPGLLGMVKGHSALFFDPGDMRFWKLERDSS